MPTLTQTEPLVAKPPAITVPKPAATTAYQAPAIQTASTAPPPESNYKVAAATPSSGSTVQGQLGNILGKNSGLLQQARTVGMRQAAQRGLTNSSIAANASQAAVYDKALPIAQQDAQTGATFQLNDQQYRQDLGKAEQAYGYDKSLSAQAYNQNAQLSSQDAKQTAGLAQQKYGFDSAQSLQDYLQKSGLSQQEAKQAADAAFSAFGYQTSINTQQNTAASKLSAQEATQLQALEAKRAQSASSLSAQEAAQLSALETKRAQQTSALSAQQAAETKARDQFGFASQASLAQQAAELDVFKAEKIAPLTERLRTLDATLASQLDRVQSENDLVLQNSLAASQLYATGLQSLATLYATPNLSQAQLTKGRENLLAQMQAGMKFMADIEAGFGGILPPDTGTVQGPGYGTTPPPAGQTGGGVTPLPGAPTPPPDAATLAIRESPEFKTQLAAYEKLKAQAAGEDGSPFSGGAFSGIFQSMYEKKLQDELKKVQAFDPTFTG